jgi:predicted ATPase
LRGKELTEKTRSKERKNSQAIPILTSIYVKNFGPIYEANIPIRNFTILMGPNNSGKSFLASLCILLARFIQQTSILLVMMDTIDVQKIAEARKVFEYVVDGALSEIFTVSSPSELVNWTAHEAEIAFTFHTGTEEMPLKFIITRDGSVSVIDRSLIFLEGFIKRLLPSYEVVYVPAERAGIMRTYRQLLRLHLETSWPSMLSSMLPSLREEFRKRYEKLIGKMIAPPGLVKIFLDEFLSIDTSRSPTMIESALYFLESAIGGKISMKEDLSITYTERQSGLEIPLERTSSSISEIAGIYLLTKLLSKDKLFIVEEPESHLHPQGQMWIARYFGQLVRNGVKVLITTHSDLIALKAAHLVGLSNISEGERVKLGYREDEFLKEDELSICFLEMTEKGSIAREIKISPTGEVENLPTYTTVLEEMYGEAIQLFELHRKVSEMS